MQSVVNFELLSLDEIQRRHDGKWVLIVDPLLDENLEVVQGQVWAHSENVEEIYRSLSLSKGHPASIEYMGDLPEDFDVKMEKIRLSLQERYQFSSESSTAYQNWAGIENDIYDKVFADELATGTIDFSD